MAEKKVKIVEKEEAETMKKKIKPELSDEMKKQLDLRKEKKSKTPDFRRQEWFRYKKLGTSWRKPRGLHSKQRTNLKYRPANVSIGYGGPKKARGLHPSGFREVMVYNPKDLEGMDPATEAARIGHGVGTKKRMDIVEKAQKMNIRVLNGGI